MKLHRSQHTSETWPSRVFTKQGMTETAVMPQPRGRRGSVTLQHSPRPSDTRTESSGGRELTSATGITRVRWAACGVVGKRDEDLMSLHGASSGEAGDLACFGVFDGHGGIEAARYASERLLARVAYADDEAIKKNGGPSDELITSAFASVDDEVWAQPDHCSGTTAVCTFVGAPAADGRCAR